MNDKDQREKEKKKLEESEDVEFKSILEQDFQKEDCVTEKEIFQVLKDVD